MRILFICTDNFSRSVMAECLTRDWIKKYELTNISVHSAGIQAHTNLAHYSRHHFKVMDHHQIDYSRFCSESEVFHRTQVTTDLLNEYDLVIAMADMHQHYVYFKCNQDIPLLNELTIGKSTSIEFDRSKLDQIDAQIDVMFDELTYKCQLLVQKIMQGLL